LFLLRKLKSEYLFAALTLLIVLDLWQVDKRYLNDKDFESKKKNQDDQFPKTPVDEFILQDKDPHFRVYNTTQRLDQDAMTSYWHKSVGGYHGAKMRRYQELIEHQMSRGNAEVYNMLNVKYFILQDSARGLFPQQNPVANGNAWFVKEYVMVENADAEIDSLTEFNSNEKVYIDRRYADQLKEFTIQPDSGATIRLTAYAPNKLDYEYTAATPQLAVFSEIHYDKGWNAYVDGQLMPHFRCDYVLRGMVLPAGNHKLEFRFEPQIVAIGERVALTSSMVLYGGIVLIGGFAWYRSRKKDDVA
jgi:hypothetical protein